MKIGLIAGGGDLPKNVLVGAQNAGHKVEVITIDGFANSVDYADNVQTSGLGEFGRIVKILRKADCTHVCFAGYIKRPNFLSMKPDLKGLKRLPGAILAAKNGDSALLDYVIKIFMDEGFEIVSPQTLCANLLLEDGHIGAYKLTASHMADALKACEIAAQIAMLDIGQSVVVCRGLILAVEAQEGTDEMLDRLLVLPANIRGTADNPEGVMAKIMASNFDNRVDLPTIGVETVLRAQKAGLAGIVAESGRAFVINKAAVIEAANAAGLFIAGLPPSKQRLVHTQPVSLNP